MEGLIIAFTRAVLANRMGISLLICLIKESTGSLQACKIAVELHRNYEVHRKSLR